MFRSKKLQRRRGYTVTALAPGLLGALIGDLFTRRSDSRSGGLWQRLQCLDCSGSDVTP